MDAVVAFIANGEATKPVEPGERALDDPAEHAKAAAVGRAATAEDRNNAAGGEAITMWLQIVATVALQDVGPSARPPAASANGGQVRDQGVEVGDVVDVRGRDMRHQRHPARIGHDVVFGPRLAAIGLVRSSFFPPRIARTDPLSSTVQRWSSRPRRRSSARRVSCKRRQTPARSHSTKRRQHVLPEPHPISRGNICHGNPPRSTNRMPVSAARSETRGRPSRRRARRRGFGSNGSRRAHSASSKRGCAMRDRTKSTAQVQEISQRF
jgi:hypothetical protein